MKTCFSQRILLLLNLLVGFAMLSGCGSTIPTLNQLSPMGGFSTNSSSFTMLSTSRVVTISGTCSSYFTDIDWSSDNGVTWQSVTLLDPTASIACTTSGTFSLSMNMSGTSTVMAAIMDNVSYSILLRGISSYGPSATVSFLLIPPAQTSLPVIMAGVYNNGAKTPSPSYIMRAHVGGTPAISTKPSTFLLLGHIHMR